MMDMKIECPMGASDECSMNCNGTCMMNCQTCIGMTREELRDSKLDQFEKCSGETEDAAITALLKAWNTRAERTCKMEYEKSEPHIHEGKLTCSECGAWAMFPPYNWSEYNYCPYCGAKVVE